MHTLNEKQQTRRAAIGWCAKPERPFRGARVALNFNA
jgi:hypothetical protein